jgi:hypothetical protein
MKKYYLLLTTITFLVLNQLNAQDLVEEDEPKLSISGSVDAYFRINLSAPNNQDATAPGSSFANNSGFALGMVNLITAYEGKKAGFVADLVFGPRGEDAVFGSPLYNPNNPFGGSSQIVNQLYAYWNVSDKVTLTLGNFNTYLGYEVISPTANFNYSTSYMFSYGPFSHTGIKADFQLTDNVTGMLSIMNPTDFTEFNPVGTYTYGAQLGFGGVYLNFLYGDQDGNINETVEVGGDPTFSSGSTFQADLTAGWDLSDKLFFGVNATYNTTGSGETFDGTNIADVDGDGFGFYGVAGYLQYAFTDAFSLGTRVEYFGEFAGGAGAIGAYDVEGDASIIDFTLSAQYKIEGLTIIPEFRLDNGSEEGTFYNRDLAASKNLTSFLVAVVYAF